MAPPHDAAFLQSTPLFRSLTHDAIGDVLSLAAVRHYPADAMIVWQGTPSEQFFVIKAGLAAVTRVGPGGPQAYIVAYLMAGESFGEVGVLDNQPRSASVVAVTDVDVFVFQRADFVRILERYASVAIDLVRIVGTYLVEANRRQVQGQGNVDVILVYSPVRAAGLTTLGHAVAARLAQAHNGATLYTEYPQPHRVLNDFGLEPADNIYPHPAKYNLYVPAYDPAIPDAARATLALDYAMANYRHVVVGLAGCPLEVVAGMLEHAHHLVLLVPAHPDAMAQLDEMARNLRQWVRPDRTQLSGVVNQVNVAQPHITVHDTAWFEIPFLPAMPALTELHADIPEPLVKVMNMIIERTQRTHQIAVYIPTTVGVNRPTDTSRWVERTRTLLGEWFGGATSRRATGVWNSRDRGLVTEMVYIIHTYATQGEMLQHLQDVVDLVKQTKVELQQEAVALEIDRKLLLV